MMQINYQSDSQWIQPKSMAVTVHKIQPLHCSIDLEPKWISQEFSEQTKTIVLVYDNSESTWTSLFTFPNMGWPKLNFNSLLEMKMLMQQLLLRSCTSDIEVLCNTVDKIILKRRCTYWKSEAVKVTKSWSPLKVS